VQRLWEQLAQQQFKALKTRSFGVKLLLMWYSCGVIESTQNSILHYELRTKNLRVLFRRMVYGFERRSFLLILFKEAKQ